MLGGQALIVELHVHQIVGELVVDKSVNVKILVFVIQLLVFASALQDIWANVVKIVNYFIFNVFDNLK